MLKESQSRNILDRRARRQLLMHDESACKEQRKRLDYES
jgi:hypothetical protein